MGATTAVVDYVRAQRDAIRTGEGAVRRDDADSVHDMRVAIRRLRSTLRTFRQLWDRDRTRRVRDELKWLADHLGAVRDGEVMLARLTKAVAAEPSELVMGPVAARIRQRLAGEIADGRRKLLVALDGPRHRDLRDAVDELVDGAGHVKNRRLRRRASRATRRAETTLDSAAGRDEQLHQARKDYKRARYAAEALTPFAGRPAKRLASQIKKLQDVLGTHQDTVVTGGLLRTYGVRAQLDGDSAFTYGLLHARQREAGRDALRGLPAAAKKARRGRKRLNW